jgi:hypothetical protein
MEAASILTTIATNASENQSQFGKLGMQRMISLWKQFPSREFVQHLVANMISNVATVRMFFLLLTQLLLLFFTFVEYAVFVSLQLFF